MTDRRLNVPEVVDESWLLQPSPNYVDGSTVMVELSGDFEGRASGLVQPQPGSARYMGGGRHHGKEIPFPSPDNYRSFHTGPMQVRTADGKTRPIQVGTIAFAGGHSANVGAKSIQAAIDWLQRKGPWSGLKDDLALYGRIEPVLEGPNAGALMFMGAAFPGLSASEAMAINATTMSGENWPDPKFGGQMVFAGPARVRRTAFPFNVPEPLAADLGETDDDGPVIVCWLDDDGQQHCEPCSDPCNQETPIMAEAPQTDVQPAGDVSSAPEGEYTAPTPEAPQEALQAELSETEVRDLITRVTALEAELAATIAELAELAIATTTGTELTLDQRFDSVSKRLAEIEERQREDAKLTAGTDTGLEGAAEENLRAA
jgi:hypothetical protein